MRAILITVVILGAIPFILRRPYVGVLFYVWISVMNPHRLTYGFTYALPFAAIIGVVTLLSCLLSKDRRRPPLDSLMVALALFALWTTVTTILAFYPEESYGRWNSLMKTMVMAFLIPILFYRQDQLRSLLWVIVLSIAYYSVKGGAWVLLTGGGERVYGPPGSYVEDNNALAVAVIMVIPLMRYLQLTSPHKLVRWGLTGAMLLSAVAALGSYSRGALVAAAATLTVFLWKSRQKFLVFFIVIATIPAVLLYLPERWYQRMDTMVNFEQDISARARLNAWATMFNLAKDRPLIGGGFEIATSDVYQRYSPDSLFKPQVAHSIYFQALGEHGFVGLGLYLLLFALCWRSAGGLGRAAGGRADLAWARDFGLMMQVSLTGFLIGGAFLSLVNFDVPYYLVGILVATKRLVDESVQQAAAPADIASSPSSAGVPRRSPEAGIG